MKQASIEDIAYILKQAKENHQPKPIFFLGAGASKSGDIPLAAEIVSDILTEYKDAPSIKNLNDDDKTYAKLMGCLQPYERDSLLKNYITKAKINVTHIYLAQLMVNDFVDYVLTVNFDNLMLRALSLFNEFPSTYDMAILKDLTTTKFKEKSVVYLHGQHHGLWLLNTEEEMDKVTTTIPRIFDSIKDKRPWVFIGYSASDPIFEHIKNLGRFDNGLYWVAYHNHEPAQQVTAFLETPNTNASIIKGYDSDSFMMTLNQQLKLLQPPIIDTPFSSLLKTLETIVDIDEEEHFKGIKERLNMAKEQTHKAIKQFEHNELNSNESLAETTEIDQLKKQVIDLILLNEYQAEPIESITEKAKVLDNIALNKLIADFHSNWGVDLYKKALKKQGMEADTFLNQACVHYQQAISISSELHETFNNWGIALANLAKTKNGEQADALFNDAVDKYQQAIAIKPNNHKAFYNWGFALAELAKTKHGDEAEKLLLEALDKQKQAVTLGDSSYNLACVYALMGDKDNALKYLRTSLDDKSIKATFVEADDDWNDYLEDDDFVNLLELFKTKL